MTSSSRDPWHDAGILSAARWSTVPVPPVVRQNLTHLFAEHIGSAPQRRRAVALPVVENDLLVVRDEPTGVTTTYTSDIADVVVTVDRGRIVGQVFPIERPTPGAFGATVLDHDDLRSFDGTDDGRFSLRTLRPGMYTLLLDNTHLEIELQVEIGEEGEL